MRLLLLLPLLLGIAQAAPHDPAQSLEPLPEAEWTLDAAGHLLRRAGFGGTPEQIAALHARGLEGAVDHLLGWEGQSDAGMAAPPITRTTQPGRAAYQGKSEDERRAIRQDYRRRDLEQFRGIREWWMQTMVRTEWPLRERLTLFWHGHFTSGQRDVRNSYHLYIQNTLFRRHAAGNFGTLLHAVSKDPAMLEYLDNRSNRRGKPNENFAREVMELFTMGPGHYTEADIREAARAFTGWTFAGNRFHVDERAHDGGEKTFLGRSGRFDGGDVLDVILEQPATARFVALALFRAFAHEWPEAAVAAELAATLREGNFEMRPLLRRILLSRAFYSPAARGNRIKSPVELLVGLYRALDIDAPEALAGVSLYAATLGHALLDPPSVKGWSGGRDWITTSTLLRRYNVAGTVVGLPEDQLRTLRDGGDRLMRAAQQMRRAAGEDDAMAPRARRGRPVFYTYDVVGEVRRRGLASAAEIVDHFAARLLASPPDAGMRKTLLDHLNRDRPFSLELRDVRARLHGLLRLLVSTPEFQLT